MSKFKVGDRVKEVNDAVCDWEGKPKTFVVSYVNGYHIALEGDPKTGESSFDETKRWFYRQDYFTLDTSRTLTLSGATYTLTPYEAPKLVTIDDVVYVMTEVV